MTIDELTPAEVVAVRTILARAAAPPPTAEPRVPTGGYIADVAPGGLIDSVWGNDIRDATVIEFANAGARDTNAPAATTKLRFCLTADTHTLWRWAPGPPTAWIAWPPSLQSFAAPAFTDPGAIAALVTLSGTIALAAVGWPRLITARTQLVLAATSADVNLQVNLSNGSTASIGFSGTFPVAAAAGQRSFMIEFTEQLAANTTRTYSVTLQRSAGAGTGSVANFADTRFCSLTARAYPLGPSIALLAGPSEEDPDA